ncbi:MAG TPA: hypothetical protein VMI54_00535 [Polyangiaceae bacterium]|nr:hypothetical protein [Polyangiaceae bacterium]
MRGFVACLLFALGALAAACKRGPAPERSVVSAAEPSDENPGELAVASVLASVHAKISLAAPAWQLQPLAFGRHLLVRAKTDRLEVLATPDFTTTMEPRLDGARAVVAVAGGSVVAVGASEALRIDPAAKAPVRLPPVAWFPGTVLLPERRDSNLLWAVHGPGKSFVRQRLALDPTRSFDKEITLEGYDGGPVASLRDGAFVFAAASGVRAGLPESRPRPLATDFPPWRLLPGRRVDEAWALAADGRVELWQLGERLLVKQRFSAGAAPFDADASPDYLALVVVDEPGDAERRFRLVVFDNDGTRVLDRALPPGEPEGGNDWAELAVRDRHVVLSESEPLVAVGGPGALEVLRLPAGERLLARE